MVVSRIITLLILLLNTIPSLEQQPTDVSETGRITSGLAIKIIGCFRDKKVPICQNKPETIDVTECANSSILGGMRISENDLNQFFEKLYETKNTPRAFQENLFSEMKTRITRKGAFYDNVILQMVDIVKKIINDNTLTDNDYIEVYCHLHVATYIVENMLKAAQSCYNDLKLLTDKLPETDREVGRTKTKVSLTKNHLFESIKNQYEPATILVKPEFSQLVGLVLKHDMGESGHIHDIVQRYVIATLEAMQAYKRSHDIHELEASEMRDQRLFEIGVLEEFAFMHIRSHRKIRILIWSAFCINILVLLTVFVELIRNSIFYIKKIASERHCQELVITYRAVAEPSNA